MDREELARQAAAAEGGADDPDDLGSENGHEDLAEEGGISSLLGQIAQLREEAKKDHHLDLPIPGTRNLLWARFRPFQSAKTERKSSQYRQLASRGHAFLLTASCDLLIDACEQIMVLPEKFDGDPGPDGENLVPIDDMVPVGFDSRLADLFVKDQTERAYIKSARQVVLAMYPTEQAVIAANVQVSEWLNDVTRTADGELVRD